LDIYRRHFNPSATERALVEQRTRCSAVGSPETVRLWLERFVGETDADELIVAGQIYDHPARL
jgi:alkanesulfonate monooxygenase SsuD/methylene tetrahydromethanopterin reductase-like flavin-dependent oxidoreductase (luciferase family)